MATVWKIAGAGAAMVAFAASALSDRSAERPLSRREQACLRTVTAMTTVEAAESLGQFGVCVLAGAVAPEVVSRCKALQCSQDSAQAKSLRKHFKQSTFGRWHRQRFSATDRQIMTDLEEAWMPIVEAYMGGPTSRTDLQLLVSQPGSAHQFFHQDNSQRALTVVVPLVDYDEDIGPTQLLLGTHTLTGTALCAIAEAALFWSAAPENEASAMASATANLHDVS